MVWTPWDQPEEGPVDGPEEVKGRPVQSTMGAPADCHLRQSLWTWPKILQKWH
jgi:hypothetical protein